VYEVADEVELTALGRSSISKHTWALVTGSRSKSRSTANEQVWYANAGGPLCYARLEGTVSS